VLGQSGNDNRFIVTVPGRGYTFVADLDDGSSGEIVVEKHTYSNIVVEQNEETNGLAHTGLLGGSKRRRNGWSLVALSALILTVAAAGYWFFVRAPSSSGAIKSVAVMPFVNDSGNPDLEYLSDGITESLIGSLSQLRDLSVKARTSISRYKGKEIDLQKVGAELSVESILTGRLVQRGDEIALYIEFVEPSTGNVFWKGEYRRPMKDLAALDKEISRDVAAKLKTRLSGEDTATLEKYQTDNSEAYQLYLRGVAFGRTEVTRERMSKSIDCFERAVKLDPNYAVAYIEMAWSYMRSGSVFGFMSPQETFPKAREALIKAVAINENLSVTHNALATYYLQYEWNWDAAEREFERAIELDPENVGAYSDYRNYYDSIGRFDDAIRVVEEGRKLSSGPAPMFKAQICNSHYYAGRLETALDCYREVLELNPRLPWPHVGIGRIYLRMKQYPQAIAELEKGVELLDRNARTVAVLGHAYAKAGRLPDAEKTLHELQARAKKEFVSPYHFAIVYAGMGERDKALEYLEQAAAERQPQLIYLRVEPLFDDIRIDPRFTSLAMKIGFPG